MAERIVAEDLTAWSWGRDKFDNRPRGFCSDWDNLVLFVQTIRAPEKGKHYMAAWFSGDGRRCKENACRRNWLPFDLDGVDGQGVTAKEFDAALEFFSGLCAIAYETASSQPGAHKARFILALDRVVTEGMSRALGRFIERGTRINGWDASVYSHAQPVYLPPVGRQVHVWRGEAMPVERVLKALPPPTPRVSRPPMDRPAPDAFQFFNIHGRILRSHAKRHAVVCPWVGSHTHGDITGTALFDPAPDNNFVGGFKCQHAHCQDKTIADVFRLMGALT
jgi:hypothetical protein